MFGVLIAKGRDTVERRWSTYVWQQDWVHVWVA